MSKRTYQPDTLEAAIYDVLAGLAEGETIVYMDQAFAEEAYNVMAFKVATRVTQGADGLAFVQDDGTHVYHGDRKGSITIHMIGSLAGDRADRLISAMKRQSASVIYRQFGPVLHSPQTVSNEPIKYDNAQVFPCAVIDLQYRIGVLHAETGGTIEYVVIKDSIRDPANKEIIRDTYFTPLGGAVPDPHKVYAVKIKEIPEYLRKVGRSVSDPVDWMPMPEPPLAGSADLVWEPLSAMRVEVVNGQTTWVFQEAGPLTITYTMHNHDGTRPYDTVTLQIQP